MRKPILYAFTAVLGLFAAGCDSDSFDDNGVRTVNFTFDLDDATLNGPVASEQYDVPAITPDVVDFGAVVVYYRFQNTWTALPYTVGVESATEPVVDYTFSIGYGYDDAFLEVFVEASTSDPVVWDDIEDAAVFQGELPMKAVIIESFDPGKTGVDLRDYDAVKRYYGLPD